MPTQSAHGLANVANTLLLTIFKCCKVEVNSPTSKQHGVTQSRFKNTTLAEVISNGGFMPDSPFEALSNFRSALVRLVLDGFIKIEGANWWQRRFDSNTLIKFTYAAETYGLEFGEDIDPDLDQKFLKYLKEHHADLAEAKIYITNNGVLNCTRRGAVRMTGSKLPPPRSNIA